MDALQAEIDDLRQRLEAYERTAGTGKLPSLDVPKLKGKGDSKTFKEFLRQFYVVAHALNWNDVTKAKLLGTCLQGGALAFYSTLPKATVEDWEAVISKMGEVFGKLSNLAMVRKELQDRMQKPGESLAEYALAIRDLVSKAFPDSEEFEAKHRASVEVDSFFGGVKSYLREQLLRKTRPENLEAALDMALEEEGIVEDVAASRMRGSELLSAAVVQSNEQSLRDEVKELRKMLEQQTLNNRPGNFRNSFQTFRGNFQRFGNQVRNWRPWDNFQRGSWQPRNNFNAPNWQNWRPSVPYFGRVPFPNNGGGQAPTAPAGPANYRPQQEARGRPNRGRGRGGRNGGGNYRINAINNVPFMLVIVACVWLIPTVAEGKHVFQICEKAKGGFLVEPPQIQKCSPSPSKGSRKAQIEVYVPKTIPDLFVA